VVRVHVPPLVQAANAAPLSEHSKVAVASVLVKLKLAEATVSGLGGVAVSATSGAMVSTVHEHETSALWTLAESEA